MRKLVYVLLIVSLALPNLFLLAQDEAVVTRLEAFSAVLPEQGYGSIALDALNVLLVEQDVTLVDVREVEEYEAGHLENSFNVPIRTLSQNLNLLPDLNAPIVVICKGASRAVLAATSLRVLGYTNVKFLSGGYDGWVAAEMPVTTEPYTIEAGTAPEFDPAVFAAVDAYLANLPQGYGLVSPQNLAVELVENAPMLIDVRSEEEWTTDGYIEGAQNIWINEFFARQDEWPADKNTPIVIYCGVGVRGGIATVMMNLMGYTNVRNLSGGLTAWKAAELPLVGVPEAEPEEVDVAALLADYVAGMPETFNALRPADLKAEIDAGTETLLVDVRTADEYAEGFIEGAINIPLNDLTQSLHLLPDLDAPMVVICGSGHRSAVATATLNLLGYTDVRSMMSGVASWAASEFPLSTVVPEYTGGTAPNFDDELFTTLDGFITNIPAGYYTVSAADLGVELIENPPFLIDVRTDGEWATGHIEGATHLTFRDFLAEQDQWPTDTTAPIVVYDNPTHRSSMAMTFLRLLGYENVRALGGGVGAWANADLPLVID